MPERVWSCCHKQQTEEKIIILNLYREMHVCAESLITSQNSKLSRKVEDLFFLESLVMNLVEARRDMVE